MNDKIILSTSSVQIQGRMRRPDMDHATTIIDHVRRGYIITARVKDAPWSVSIYGTPKRSFINQPEGTEEVIFWRVNFWADNAALYDEMPPEWVTKLERCMELAIPSTTYLSKNMTTTKETPCPTN